MSTIARKKRLDGPVRHKMAVASGYSPAVNDKVILSGVNEANALTAATASKNFIGMIYDPAADGDTDYCIVELKYNNLESIPSQAAISAVGPGTFKGAKVAAIGSDTFEYYNCMIFETATGADENVIVGW
jgi:hypothetical protein